MRSLPARSDEVAVADRRACGRLTTHRTTDRDGRAGRPTCRSDGIPRLLLARVTVADTDSPNRPNERDRETEPSTRQSTLPLHTYRCNGDTGNCQRKSIISLFTSFEGTPTPAGARHKLTFPGGPGSGVGGSRRPSRTGRRVPHGQAAAREHSVAGCDTSPGGARERVDAGARRLPSEVECGPDTDPPSRVRREPADRQSGR